MEASQEAKIVLTKNLSFDFACDNSVSSASADQPHARRCIKQTYTQKLLLHRVKNFQFDMHIHVIGN